MLPKKNYYIKFGITNTIIKSDGKVIQFKLEDRGNFNTINAGRIGDFEFFETQLKAELKKLGFNKWTWKNKVVYVAVPINSSRTDMKMVIDSLECVGFREIYTIFEHYALIYDLNKAKSFKQKFGIINIEDDRIDFGLINGQKIDKSTSIDLGYERMNRYFSNLKLLAILEALVFDEIEYFFKDSMDELEVVITGNRKSKISSINKLLQHKRVKITIIDNGAETIIKGLEAIARRNYIS